MMLCSYVAHLGRVARPCPAGLEILVDSTQDAFGPRAWTREICRGFTVDQAFGFIGDDCDAAVMIR